MTAAYDFDKITNCKLTAFEYISNLGLKLFGSRLYHAPYVHQISFWRTQNIAQKLFSNFWKFYTRF